MKWVVLIIGLVILTTINVELTKAAGLPLWAELPIGFFLGVPFGFWWAEKYQVFYDYTS